MLVDSEKYKCNVSNDFSCFIVFKPLSKQNVMFYMAQNLSKRDPEYKTKIILD